MQPYWGSFSSFCLLILVDLQLLTWFSILWMPEVTMMCWNTLLSSAHTRPSTTARTEAVRLQLYRIASSPKTWNRFLEIRVREDGPEHSCLTVSIWDSGSLCKIESLFMTDFALLGVNTKQIHLHWDGRHVANANLSHAESAKIFSRLHNLELALGGHVEVGARLAW